MTGELQHGGVHGVSRQADTDGLLRGQDAVPAHGVMSSRAHIYVRVLALMERRLSCSQSFETSVASFEIKLQESMCYVSLSALNGPVLASTEYWHFSVARESTDTLIHSTAGSC